MNKQKRFNAVEFLMFHQQPELIDKYPLSQTARLFNATNTPNDVVATLSTTNFSRILIGTSFIDANTDTSNWKTYIL